MRTSETREPCLDCTKKHVSQARAHAAVHISGSVFVHVGQCRVLGCETCKGYKKHKWFLIGHLAEAEDEAIAWPQVVARINRERKQYELGNIMPDWDALMEWIIDFDDDITAIQARELGIAEAETPGS